MAILILIFFGSGGKKDDDDDDAHLLTIDIHFLIANVDIPDNRVL